jgi:hypothetical protein
MVWPKKRGTAKKVAQAYLEVPLLAGRPELAAKHYYRPVNPEHADPADVARFPKVELITIEDLGGWQAAQKKHFADGGVFDQGSTDRRSGGGRRHPGAGARHHRDPGQDRPAPRRLAIPPPQQQPRPTPRRSSSSCARATRKGLQRLARSGQGRALQVITPNPKTSGGVSRYNYLAAWGYQRDQDRARRLLSKLNDPAHAAATKAARRQRSGSGLRHRASTSTSLCSTAARAVRLTHLRPARNRRRAASPGRTRRTSPSTTWAATSSRSFALRLVSWPSLPSPGWIKTSKSTAPQNWPRLTSEYPLFRLMASALAAKHYYRPSKPEARRPRGYDARFHQAGLW